MFKGSFPTAHRSLRLSEQGLGLRVPERKEQPQGVIVLFQVYIRGTAS